MALSELLFSQVFFFYGLVVLEAFDLGVLFKLLKKQSAKSNSLYKFFFSLLIYVMAKSVHNSICLIDNSLIDMNLGRKLFRG